MKLALSFALISGVAAFAPTAQVRYRIGLVTHEFLRGRLLTGWHSEIDVYYGYFPRNNSAEKFDHSLNTAANTSHQYIYSFLPHLHNLTPCLRTCSSTAILHHPTMKHYTKCYDENTDDTSTTFIPLSLYNIISDRSLHHHPRTAQAWFRWYG